MAIEDSGITQVNLLRIYDQLRAVEHGLNGFIGIVCQGKRKRINLNVDDFYFAINPLHEKLDEAIALLDVTHKRMKQLPSAIPQRHASG